MVMSDLIPCNYLWHHKIKMATTIMGLSYDLYGRLWEEWSYLGQERRYRALTYRYGYNVSEGTQSSKLLKVTRNHFYALFQLYTSQLELDIFFLGQDMTIQIFLPIVVHEIVWKSQRRLVMCHQASHDLKGNLYLIQPEHLIVPLP